MLLLRHFKRNIFIRNYGKPATAANASKKSTWKSVVGLEVHAQISSESKLFSGSRTVFGAPVNSAVACFDASIPGTLPVINRKCVEAGVKTALALDCKVNAISMFDRKHYFYADLPTGYQITQQRHALANNGIMRFPVISPGKKIYYKTVNLLQLQLEQDSGKSLHDEQLKRSLVDLNRAGIPLMEFVFAPDLETGDEAASLIKELILTLKRLKTCSCKMEEGALRVDANISVHQEGTPFGVRTEVKNIGSVRGVYHAITHEIERQLDIVKQGGIITNETRSWDAEKRCTVAMRDKEVLQDYRFMPEPNLPPIRLSTIETQDPDLVSIPEISKDLPELPEQTRSRLTETYQLNPEVAVILVNESTLLEWFFQIKKLIPEVPTKSITNFFINDLLKFCNKLNIDVEECQITVTHLKDILSALHADEINLQAAKKLIELSHENPQSDINELIREHNFKQITDTKAIDELCQEAIARQGEAVKQYRKGKSKALFAIVGEAAKISEQKANMKLVVRRLEEILKSNNENTK